MDTIYTSRVARLQAIRHLNAQSTAYLDLSLQRRASWEPGDLLSK